MSNALRRVASLRRVPSSAQFPRLSPPPSPPPSANRPISALEQLERDLLRCSPCEDLANPSGFAPRGTADDHASSSVRVLRSDGSRVQHLAVRSVDNFDAHQRRRLAASFPTSPAWEAAACEREADIVRATAAVVGNETNASQQVPVGGSAQSMRVLEGVASVDEALSADANGVAPVLLANDSALVPATQRNHRKVQTDTSCAAVARAVDARAVADKSAEHQFEGRVARQIDIAAAAASSLANPLPRPPTPTEGNRNHVTINTATRAVERALCASGSSRSPSSLSLEQRHPVASNESISSTVKTNRAAEVRVASVVDKAFLTSPGIRCVVAGAAQAISAALGSAAEASAAAEHAATVTATRAVNQAAAIATAGAAKQWAAATEQAAVAVTNAVARTCGQNEQSSQSLVASTVRTIDRVAECAAEVLKQRAAEDKLDQVRSERRAASVVDNAVPRDEKRAMALSAATAAPLVDFNVDVAKALANLVVVSNRVCSEFRQAEAKRSFDENVCTAVKGVQAGLRSQAHEATCDVSYAASAQHTHLQQEHAADTHAALRTAVKHVNALGRVTDGEVVEAARAVDQHCRPQILACQRQREAQQRAAEVAVNRLCAAPVDPAEVLTAVRHLDGSVAQANTEEQIRLIRRSADAVTGLIELRNSKAAIVAASEVDVALHKDANGARIVTTATRRGLLAGKSTPEEETEPRSIFPRRAEHDVKMAASAVDQVAEEHEQKQALKRLVTNTAALVDRRVNGDGVALDDWMASSVASVVATVDAQAADRAHKYDAALATAIAAVDDEISAVLAAEAVGAELERQRGAVECGSTEKELAAVDAMILSATMDAPSTTEVTDEEERASLAMLQDSQQNDDVTDDDRHAAQMPKDDERISVAEAALPEDSVTRDPRTSEENHFATADGQSATATPVAQDEDDEAARSASDDDDSNETAAALQPATPVAASLPMTIDVVNLDKPVPRTTSAPASDYAVEAVETYPAATSTPVSSLESVLGQLDYESIRRIILTPAEVAKAVRYPPMARKPEM